MTTITPLIPHACPIGGLGVLGGLVYPGWVVDSKEGWSLLFIVYLSRAFDVNTCRLIRLLKKPIPWPTVYLDPITINRQTVILVPFSPRRPIPSHTTTFGDHHRQTATTLPFVDEFGS
jgi:hypothetical protein